MARARLLLCRAEADGGVAERGSTSRGFTVYSSVCLTFYRSVFLFPRVLLLYWIMGASRVDLPVLAVQCPGSLRHGAGRVACPHRFVRASCPS